MPCEREQDRFSTALRVGIQRTRRTGSTILCAGDGPIIKRFGDLFCALTNLTEPAPAASAKATRVIQVSERGAMATGEIVLLVLAQLECSLTLLRAMRVCRLWHRVLRRGPGLPAAPIWAHAWLTVPLLGPQGEPVLDADAVLRRAPSGERVRVRSGTLLSGELVRSRPLHLRAEAGVTLCGRLVLRDDSSPGRLGLREPPGLIEGIECTHSTEEAVVVSGGSWHFERCTFGSSTCAASATAAATALPPSVSRTQTLRSCERAIPHVRNGHRAHLFARTAQEVPRRQRSDHRPERRDPTAGAVHHPRCHLRCHGWACALLCAREGVRGDQHP